MSKETIEFCKSLATLSADISTILIEHISDNDEVLPHVFLADVTRYILADGKDSQTIIKFLDDVFSSRGRDVEDLIAVSFVEYLDPKEFDRATHGVDVPHIRKEWHRQQLEHSKTSTIASKC